MKKDLTIMIGGAAGQGLQVIGQVLSRALARTGLHVFANQEYESRIRGGHSFFQIRASTTRVDAQHDTVDILVALNEETIHLHEGQTAPHGLVMYDSDLIKTEYSGDQYLPLPLSTLSMEIAGSKRMANTVAVGAAWSAMGMDVRVVEGVLETIFGRRGSDIVEKNVQVVRAGTKRGTKVRTEALALEAPGGPARLLLPGNEAVALGAIAAGCKFYSAYPMSPSTGVMEFLTAHGSEFGIVVEQAEDEIAAIHMAIGASFMGTRSMTGTSGGGFALMAEGLGLAGCAEIPLVIFEAQRPGPATGMPTRTGQGDLLFLTFASQDEFPRVVLAPTTPESAFQLTVHAFNLADRHQTPVFVLSDHHLAASYWTVDALATEGVVVDRGELAAAEDLASGADYLRYRFTPSGISPRAWPGQGRALVVSTGDEHDESGHISEEAKNRTQMVDKRWRKLEHLEAGPGLEADIQEDAAIVLLGWGSTYGAIREAAERLRAEGERISWVQLHRLWPFPSEELTGLLRGHEHVVVIENNSMGQMARLMRMETGIQATEQIHKYDGRPFSPQDIVQHNVILKGFV